MPSKSSTQLLNGFRVISLLEQAELWAERGQMDRARRLYHQARQWDPGGIARLRFGEFLYQQGEYDEAAAEFAFVLELGRRHQEPVWCAAASHHLAVICRERGQTALALSHQQQEIAARLRSRGEAISDCSPPTDFPALANSAISRGELDDAGQFAELGVKLAESRNCPTDLADAWGTWAAVRLLQSDARSAWRGFLRAYAGHSRARESEGRIADLLNLAQTAREFGWWTVVEKLLIKAGKVAKETGHLRLIPKQQRFLDEAKRVLAVAERTPEWN